MAFTLECVKCGIITTPCCGNTSTVTEDFNGLRIIENGGTIAKFYAPFEVYYSGNGARLSDQKGNKFNFDLSQTIYTTLAEIQDIIKNCRCPSASGINTITLNYNSASEQLTLDIDGIVANTNISVDPSLIEITDGDLATAGTPVISDITNYVTANNTRHAYIYYIGGGTASEPDYVWYVNNAGAVVETEEIGGITTVTTATAEITDGDLATAGSPTPADVIAFGTAGGHQEKYIYYIGGGTAQQPDYVWFFNQLNEVIELQAPVTPATITTPRAEITDANLATAGSPTPADVVAFATANNHRESYIYYIGNGTADEPQWLWFSNQAFQVTEIDDPTVLALSNTPWTFNLTGAPADLQQVLDFIDASELVRGHIFESAADITQAQVVSSSFFYVTGTLARFVTLPGVAANGVAPSATEVIPGIMKVIRNNSTQNLSIQTLAGVNIEGADAGSEVLGPGETMFLTATRNGATQDWQVLGIIGQSATPSNKLNYQVAIAGSPTDSYVEVYVEGGADGDVTATWLNGILTFTVPDGVRLIRAAITGRTGQAGTVDTANSNSLTIVHDHSADNGGAPTFDISEDNYSPPIHNTWGETSRAITGLSTAPFTEVFAPSYTHQIVSVAGGVLTTRFLNLSSVPFFKIVYSWQS